MTNGNDAEYLIHALRSMETGFATLGDRILFEDNYGGKYVLNAVRVVGAKTSDPGLVVKIERV